MRTRAHTAVAAALAAASVTALVVAAPGFARPQTTNTPQMLMVKVTITDNTITMKPAIAQRGSNALFILSNHGTKPHTLILGDAERGLGKKIGFTTTLGPDEQRTIVMFLDYRGKLAYSSGEKADARKSGMKGTFKIT